MMDNHFDQVFVKTEPNEFVEAENVVENFNNSNSLININKNHEKQENPALTRTEIYIKSEPHDISTSEDLNFTYCHVDVDESSNRTYETRSKLLDAKNELKDHNVSQEDLITSNKSKRNRKVIDLDTKIRIVKAYENGRRVTSIAKQENLNSSTVSTILKEKEKIKEYGKSMIGKNIIMLTKRRDESVVKMEELLRPWIMENITKRNFLTLKLIQSKAKSLYDEVKEGNEKFSASNGWFHNFQKRYGLNHVKVMSAYGFTTTDLAAVNQFKNEFKQFINKEGYLPEQVFNVDEVYLSWKVLPEDTYLHEQIKALPDYNLQKDRVTLILGGNMAGYKLKPFITGEEENPYEILSLPVHYKTNSNHCITSTIFEEWFTNYLVPEVKNYCKNKNIKFKILFLIDASPIHPRYSLNLLNEDVKVVFLPENTNSVLQPMEQRAIEIFKAYYIKSFFTSAIMSMERGVPLLDFWLKYNLLDAIQNIDYSWKEISETCMLGIWNKIMDNNSTLLPKIEDSIIPDLIKLGQQLNFALEYDYVKRLINEEYDSSSEELLELFVNEREEERRIKEEADSWSPSSSPGLDPPSTSIYDQISPQLNKLYSVIRLRDNDKGRCERVIKKIENIVSCYKKS